MQSLAHVEKIIGLAPIEGKDRIEIAQILGWQVIVQKGYSVGDLVVYVEQDTVLPEKEKFEFLRSRCYSERQKGFRIRAMKMSGIISQGIVFPLSIIDDASKLKEGEDVTILLGVKKYSNEKELTISEPRKQKNKFVLWMLKYIPFTRMFFKRKGKDKFPGFLHKTDEQRLENVPWVLEKFPDVFCYITEKLDGSSATYAKYKRKFYVCSRNLTISYSDNSQWWRVAKMYDLKKSIPEGYAVQGEVIGEEIQGNKYNISDVDFYVFNIFEIKKNRYLSFNEMLVFCAKYHFKMVPILRIKTKLSYNLLSQLWVEFSNDYSKINDKVLREGIVIRAMDNENRYISKVGQILSVKVINPEFMIKHNL